MANKTIPELTSASLPLAGDEVLHAVQEGNSRKVDVDGIRGPILSSLADLELAEGDLLYVNGSDGLARLPKGAAGQVLRQNAGLTAPEWVTPPFSKEYVSGEQTITPSSFLTLTHGLGSAPKIIAFELVCKTASNGYTVGQIVQLSVWAATVAGSGHYGVDAKKNETQIIVHFLPSIVISHGTTASEGAVITAANWRLIVRAWA